MGLRFLAALVATLGGSVPAIAQDVTLSSRNGALSVEGTLRAYDGEFYRIDSAFGPLTLDGQAVICTGPGCPDLTAPFATIRLAGAPEMGPGLIAPLLRAFAKAEGFRVTDADDGLLLSDPSQGRSLARVTFSPMDPAAARAALAGGAVDLVVSSRAEADFTERTLAMDALVPVTAPGNPLPSIATTDLARVLSGDVTTWAQIGGPDMPLVLHGLARETALQEALTARLGRDVVASVLHATPSDLARAVAADPYAMAVTPHSTLGPARALPLTDSCAFPLDPTPLSLKAGDYPLAMPLYLLAPRRRLPLLARDFLDFAASPRAQAVIAAAGLIDRRPERHPLSADGSRVLNALRGAAPGTTLQDLQRLAAAMDGADRLSLTFRFEDGSGALDAASQDNLTDLARLYAIGTFSGQDLVLAGFSDGTGTAAENLALSQAQADGIAAAIALAATDRPFGQTLPRVVAFGDALPMACDTTSGGRRLNRRVEVWLRPTVPAAATDTPAP